LSFNVQVRRAAELDVAAAQIWYETQRSGLGAEFHFEVSQSLPDLLKLRLFTPLSIRMFEGPLFTAFRISSGIEFKPKT